MTKTSLLLGAILISGHPLYIFYPWYLLWHVEPRLSIHDKLKQTVCCSPKQITLCPLQFPRFFVTFSPDYSMIRFDEHVSCLKRKNNFCNFSSLSSNSSFVCCPQGIRLWKLALWKRDDMESSTIMRTQIVWRHNESKLFLREDVWREGKSESVQFCTQRRNMVSLTFLCGPS